MENNHIEFSDPIPDSPPERQVQDVLEWALNAGLKVEFVRVRTDWGVAYQAQFIGKVGTRQMTYLVTESNLGAVIRHISDKYRAIFETCCCPPMPLKRK